MSTYPGVYIFEKSSLSLGSAGMSGLLPLLVGRFKNKDGTEVMSAAGLTYIASYTEFADRFMSAPLFLKLTAAGVVSTAAAASDDEELDVIDKPKAKKASAKSEAANPEIDEVTTQADPAPIKLAVANLNLAALALGNYFNNGGGPCYLLSMGAAEAATVVTKQIEEYSELSLLAVIDSDTAKTKGISDELATFITTNPQSFLLAADADAATTPIKPTYSNEQHVAVYTPDLKLSSSPALYDEGILIQDSKTATVFTPLSDLQNSSEADEASYKAVKLALSKTLITYDVALTNPVISPLAAVAGAYCTTERSRGIWKAPANISLIGVSPTVAIGKIQHGTLNNLGINAIIWQPSNGTAIMGARTLEVAAKTAWRYVPVRLLFNTVERDIRSMLSPVVFEPNSAATWQSVIAAINNYLYKLWKKGGLYGRTPEEAYRVGLALEDDDIDNGILRVRVGLAALRPVEFIYLEFTQDFPVTA